MDSADVVPEGVSRLVWALEGATLDAAAQQLAKRVATDLEAMMEAGVIVRLVLAMRGEVPTSVLKLLTLLCQAGCCREIIQVGGLVALIALIDAEVQVGECLKMLRVLMIADPETFIRSRKGVASLVDLLYHSENEDHIDEAVTTVFHVSYFNEVEILSSALIGMGVIPGLMLHVCAAKSQRTYEILGALTNLCSRENLTAHLACAAAGMVPRLLEFVNSHDKRHSDAACLLIYNLCAEPTVCQPMLQQTVGLVKALTDARDRSIEGASRALSGLHDQACCRRWRWWCGSCCCV